METVGLSILNICCLGNTWGGDEIPLAWMVTSAGHHEIQFVLIGRCLRNELHNRKLNQPKACLSHFLFASGLFPSGPFGQLPFQGGELGKQARNKPSLWLYTSQQARIVSQQETILIFLIICFILIIGSECDLQLLNKSELVNRYGFAHHNKPGFNKQHLYSNVRTQAGSVLCTIVWWGPWSSTSRASTNAWLFWQISS